MECQSKTSRKQSGDESRTMKKTVYLPSTPGKDSCWIVTLAS
jgi:hypothetical protein